DGGPTGAWPPPSALKDVSDALARAREMGIAAPGAALAEARMQVARDAGFGAEYFPVLARVTGRDAGRE
ncbi:MAG: NAD(P)-dependent oxidoreductase, partial [Pseudomonadota bacterium]|nr:NAD(P)-dependent oxidoreductase [Pseudomonadota bacterium]